MIIFSDRFTDQGILIISGGQLRRFVLLGLVCSLGTGALGGEFGPLTGVVVSAAQQPIAGAEVTLFNFDHEQEEPRAAGRTRTDAQGHFAFASAEVGFSSLRARANSLAPAFSFVRAGENAITLGRPVVMTVTVQAPGGQPVAGARWREFRANYGSGDFRTYRHCFSTYGLETPVSDASGKIRTPALPEGIQFFGIIEHPDYAASELSQKVTAGAAPTVELSMGIPVSLHIANAAEMGIKSVILDLQPQSYERSCLSVNRIPYALDGKQQLRLTLDKGPYRQFELRHRDFVITPSFAPDARGDLIDLSRCDLSRQPFTLHRKVKAKGRCVSTEGGSPVADVGVLGAIPNQVLPEFERIRGWAWAVTDFRGSDAEGRFEVTLAPGPARIEVYSETHASAAAFLAVDVNERRSPLLPDIKMSPIPPVRGRVVGVDGRPAPKCVVRYRGDLTRLPYRALTDEQGRFELPPAAIPIDPDSEKRLPVQPLIAFDAYRPCSGIVEVDLANREAVANVRIVLKAGKWEDPLADIGDKFTAWERGEIPDNLRYRTAGSLEGKRAPDFEGLAWFNAERPTLKLADFRGRYLMLDFWFIGCGACVRQEAGNELLWKLYKDRGFSLAGIHNNSANPEEVRHYADKMGLTYLQAVDHKDGRAVAAYKVRAFPTFVLLDRDGRVIHEDGRTPGLGLWNFRIEIVRSLVMRQQDETH